MINYGHFIGGKRVAGDFGPEADVFQPMDGAVRANGRAGLQGRGSRGGRKRQGGAARLGRDQSAAARPRAHEVHRPDRPEQ